MRESDPKKEDPKRKVRQVCIDPEEFAEDIARLDREDFLLPLPMMWSVSGRQPAA